MKLLLAGLLGLSLTVEAADTVLLSELLTKTICSSGTNYIRARNNIITHGKTLLPALQTATEDRSLNWQQRLMARICVEWMTRGSEVDALRAHSWETDPERELQMGGSIIGLGDDIWFLAAKRFKERRLWYYYLEILLKETGEYSVGCRHPSVSRYWPRYARNALYGEPEDFYRINDLREVLRRDPELKTREAYGAYAHAIRNKVSEVMPELLATFPFWLDFHAESVKDRVCFDRFPQLIQFARPQDAELIERCMKIRPILERFRPRVDALRKLPSVKETTEPPFQPGHSPRYVIPHKTEK
jgi:hypothetical protein